MGRKVLDGAKYVGKNFWKVLPVGSIVNYDNKDKKGLIKPSFGKYCFHLLYGIAIAVGLTNYTIEGINSGAWTPKQIKACNEVRRIKKEIEKTELDETNYYYERIFKDADAKTFQDSLEIYQKYGLPIILLNPTLEQKEKAIKQNELERSVEYEKQFH